MSQPRPTRPDLYDRRRFLSAATAGAAGAGLGLAIPGAGHATTPDARTRSRIPALTGRSEPWGRLEPVADRAWALVSTPLVDHPHARRTLCNGGIIAGSDGVLVVEAFGSRDGAAWMADQALRLAGDRPTHVVLTHYHGDHVTGGAGYLLAGASPKILATRTTHRLIAEQEAALPDERPQARGVLMPDVVLADDTAREIDLGDRRVRLAGLRGHTPSDLVLEVDGALYAGDLVWNGMFPNYMDAIPSELSRDVRALRDRAGVYVSGHGELAGRDDLERYIDLLDHVEAAARRAIRSGRPLEEAAAAYAVPEALGTWHMFSPRYPAIAFAAWARELGAAVP